VNEVLETIEKKGGMWAALESGWLRQQIDASRMRVQAEINEGKRLIVGVNAFQGEDGPINKAIERTSTRVPSKQLRLRTISAVKKLRARRDQQKAQATIRELYAVTKSGKNVVRAAIEASKAGVTVGEVTGTIRLAYGYSYDPLGQIDTPAFVKAALGVE
jgi:methylmalonyl-CoA mutase N-terminal domain/subunit